MLRWVLALVLFVCGAAAAQACPSLGAKDKHLYFSTRQLVTPKAAQVRAGGTVLLGQCETLPGVGNIPFEPSVSIHYRIDRKRMDLEMRTEGDCDTVLLVHTPSGRWFFDDDNGDGVNARLRIGGPAEGRYEIWVGSAAGHACPSSLTLQTFRGSVKLADRGRSRI